ncbi:HNH endonuclease [Anaerosinus massiliensis]|uniref:HNH endonuclease n=1 Tax=Massilibacillus massiliensis TaxID=1806837 RepID=UPI000DA62951|nr:HNH endonuclease [Massilibacillus massiliensis]
MAKEFAKAFYNSGAWKKASKTYAASKFFLCEKCGRQGYIVHHKETLTPSNINDPAIALGWNNLMYLCLDCHNAIHGKQDSRQAVFDTNGDMVGIVEAPPNCV